MPTRSKLLATIVDVSGNAWGLPSKTRGAANMQLAMDFVAAFPVGTSLTAEEFDTWAQKQGLLNVPPSSAPKDSDAWKAHLMRRHELRYRIINAGSHPRLRDNGSTPFSFDTTQQGHYAVRSPQEAVTHSSIPAKIASLAKTKKRRLDYLMQSEDWDQLSPYLKLAAETLYWDIDNMQENVNRQADQIQAKFDKLTGQIQKAIAAGSLQPKNGGIGRLLSPPDDNGDE